MLSGCSRLVDGQTTREETAKGEARRQLLKTAALGRAKGPAAAAGKEPHPSRK